MADENADLPQRFCLLEPDRADLPRPLFPVVQGQKAQLIDYSGAPNQVEGANGIGGCGLSKERESAAVDHGRTEG